MPRHRSLTLSKLVKAIDPELMGRYFAKKFPDAKLPVHIIVDIDTIEAFMDDPINAKAKVYLQQDFRMINDICEKGKNLIVRAYNYFDIPWDDSHKPENMAMKLFLDHKDAFDYAYVWYCYYHASSKMSHHHLSGDFKPTGKNLKTFLKETKEWFKGLAKGRECLITPYNEEGSTVILIKHGSYIRTVAYWNEEKIEMISFRPASEDILLYNKKTEILSIKASLQKDRERYITSFSRCIMGDESLAKSEDRDTIYTLKPLQDGSFKWDGDESIKKIILTEVILRLPGGTESVIKIGSKDVRQTLTKDISDISLDSGELTYAHFRFVLDIEDKKQVCQVKLI